MEQDIRWEQRFSNYLKALKKLEEAVEYIVESDEDLESENAWDVMDEMMKEALIKRFEYTYELAWNVMCDYVKYAGKPDVAGPRAAMREAFQLGLIKDGHVWMNMIDSRNLTSHTYNEDTANKIFARIMNDYRSVFTEFRDTMESKRSGEQKDIFE